MTRMSPYWLDNRLNPVTRINLTLWLKSEFDIATGTNLTMCIGHWWWSMEFITYSQLLFTNYTLQYSLQRLIQCYCIYSTTLPVCTEQTSLKSSRCSVLHTVQLYMNWIWWHVQISVMWHFKADGSPFTPSISLYLQLTTCLHCILHSNFQTHSITHSLWTVLSYILHWSLFLC